MKNILIVISAPSGTGKTTICKKLISRNKDIVYSVSYTTRPARPGEINGQDYNFVTEKVFKKMIKSNRFLEYAKVYGHFYGTDKEFVLKNLKRYDVLLDVDVQGAAVIKKKFPNNSLLIYLFPPSVNELKKRMKKRDKKDIIIEQRLKFLDEEIKSVSIYDFILVNRDINEVVEKIEQLISVKKHEKR